MKSPFAACELELIIVGLQASDGVAEVSLWQMSNRPRPRVSNCCCLVECLGLGPILGSQPLWAIKDQPGGSKKTTQFSNSILYLYKIYAQASPQRRTFYIHFTP